MSIKIQANSLIRIIVLIIIFVLIAIVSYLDNLQYAQIKKINLRIDSLTIIRYSNIKK